MEAQKNSYGFPTLIEPDPNKEGDYQVVGQDGPVAMPLFWGSYDECKEWQDAQ